MKVYYLKGLSTDSKELNLLSSMFKNNDIEFIPLINDYTQVYNYNQKDMINHLKSFINQSEEINIVCHSMGCNLGVLLANSLENINSITLISPEFVQTTKEEKKNRELSNNKNKYTLNYEKDILKKLKSLKLFINSSKWITPELDNFYENKAKKSIIFSKGDLFVSKKYIDLISNKYDIVANEIDSNSHNPLFEDDYTFSIIKDNIKTKEMIN